MPKADTSVKFFTSDMPNGPVLAGVVGRLRQLLNACLIDGFDTRTINTLTVSAGIATATISAGHAYEQYAVIEISGATQAGLNGQWRIATATATTFTFDTGGLADGSATGTITVKRAPLGWLKPFEDVENNVVVYRSPVFESTEMYLRVNDNFTTMARVRGYEQMTNVNTGINPFPTLTQIADNSFCWQKSTSSDSVVKKWVLAGTDTYLVLMVYSSSSYPEISVLYEFGDHIKIRPDDMYHCCISAHVASAPLVGIETSIGTTYGFASSSIASGSYFARNSDQTTLSQQAGWNGYARSLGGAYSSGNSRIDGVGLDGKAHFYKVFGIDSGEHLRSIRPGVFFRVEAYDSKDNRKITVHEGVPLLMVRSGYTDNNVHRYVGIQAVGPWA